MTIETLKKAIKGKYDDATDKIGFLNDIRLFLHELSPMKHNPVDYVKWVKVDKLVANDYNPNVVADNEMELLYTSIKHDGYTQPIVSVYDKGNDLNVIVDGFHRYVIPRIKKDIYDLNQGYLPVTVIDKEIKDRMASTIRHNRARGKHKIEGMGKLVFKMLEEGWTDSEICKELGMEAEEIVKLKHVTGFSKLFENIEYQKAWKTKTQLRLEQKYRDSLK